MRSNYDAVIVGARVAGAATAMLMAESGAEVLVIDRAGPGVDTISTHALMRGAVNQLERWGLLDDVVAAGTPAITRTVFRYPGHETPIDIEPLYAPRRTVLDPIVVDGARRAGAEVLHRTRAVGIGRDDTGRIRSVEIEHGGARRRVRTDLLVGADGLRSWVARGVGARVTRRGATPNGAILAYVADTDLPDDTYIWAYGHEVTGGSIPTNDGHHVLFASAPPRRFRLEVAEGVPTALASLLDRLDPELYDAFGRGSVVGRARSWPGHVGQFREAHGPGWALVGDAGYFKDPGAAHGITDAFRDAELLARATVTGDLAGYERTRNRLSAPLFAALEAVADHSWTLPELPERLIAMARAMKDELGEFEAITGAVVREGAAA